MFELMQTQSQNVIDACQTNRLHPRPTHVLLIGENTECVNRYNDYL